ncbi:MAG: glycosyltransferase family 4 protein [Opitutaceae bacterium]|nr:glycosyltransferase family 4 protein [Opitutaceae bacterium]MBP9912178.1 glycosyltransferase family 4 protein [Opitutaceae bacterium]
MPFCTSHVDAPTPGSVLPAGRHLLRGWVWPGAGGQFVDVRARVEGRAFPGIHGRPRPDLAAHFNTGRRPALAEFQVAVDLPPGPVVITLEVLEIEGRWTPFQTVHYQITGAAVAAEAPAIPEPKPLHWHDFTRGLDFLLRSRRHQPAASWIRLAAELAADFPVNQDLLHPPAPFIGHADEPAVVNSSRFGLLPVVGYLFHQREKIKKLWISAELQTLQPLTLGRATPNLVEHFPQYPNAAVSGYEGFVDVPPQLPNPAVLRIYAETETEPLQLVQVRTVRRHDAEIEKYPCQGTAEEFSAALTAWKSALRVRGFRLLPEATLLPAIDQLRTDYTRPAPALARPVTPAAPRELNHIILASHNLNLEGAPLFLLDLARGLIAEGIRLTVVSPSEGVLRERFAALGAQVVIVDAAPVFRADSETAAQAGLLAIGRAVDFAAADLVIGNTFTTFWAVHAAKAAGCRVLYYVHESTSPAAFYRREIQPAVLALAEAALVLAEAVSFTSDATRRYHAWPGRPVNAVLTPGWVDLNWIDGWLAQQPRETLRARFNLQPGEILVTNVGTICDRKGQLGFARAVELFNRRHPALATRVRFVLLGGRNQWFDGYLREVLATLEVPNLTVHPETPDFLGYYAAADLTVCSSLEESSPRVVLEAMACGTPLLASDIPGISEMARDGLEAALVTPGHTTEWAEALARVLNAPAEARARAKQARARIESHFAARIVLPRHLALAHAVAADQSVV